jgi:aminoglycoside phosphotransferase (APT) family kinase protein
MPYDDVAWEKSDTTFDTWKKQLYDADTLREIGQLIAQHRGGVPEELYAPIRGAFNVCLRMRFRDGGSALIRFPCPGVVMFPEEKVRAEVAVMRYIKHHTSIPVPFVLHYGMTDESPRGLGPFIIMEYVEHAHDLVDVLNTPGLGLQDRPVLDPNISEERLEFVYSQMADILLQLSKCAFPRIGSLVETDDDDDDDDDRWTITKRPLTLNMNELVQLGNFPRARLPSGTFSTSSTYYSALADMHLEHLSTQHNDAIESADDCRSKYIARQLFRKLASQSRLSGEHDLEAGPFRLFCDDLRPANVLVNAEFQIVAVLDWEFTYAAPVEFTYSPPWWLLLEMPEYWTRGLEDWATTYERRLGTFLRVLEEREREGREKDERERGISGDSQMLLSTRMRESWESGAFWVNYAARKSWAFDGVFWNWLDRKFFGDENDGGGFMGRLKLLGREEREGMEVFVQRKLEEAKERILVGWEGDGVM